MSGTSAKKEAPPAPSHVKKKDETEKKQSEGRKYAKISPESIKMISESAGVLGFTDEMANKLSEDVTYRLREVLHHASIFLRHSKRKKLLPSDIEEVLEDYDIPAVVGHSPFERVDVVHVDEPDVFAYNDEEEDLVKLAFESKELVQPGDTVIKDSKIAPTFQEAAQSAPQPVIKQEEPVPTTSKADEPSIRLKLPQHLLTYYDRISMVLLGCSKNHFEVVMADLLINDKIGTIIPYILNLLAMSLQKVPPKRSQFLHAVLVLTYNKNIELSCSVSVHRLVSALLLCALGTKAVEKVSAEDDFQVRGEAALVLSKVVSEWCKGESKLQLDIMQKLGTVLLNGSSPLKSHYGALACLVALGNEALEYCLWPNLAQYLSFLETKPVNQEIKEVEGAMLNAAEYLYRLEWTRMSDPTVLPQGILVIDRLLASYFGDALCTRWAPVMTCANEISGETEEASTSYSKANSSEVWESRTLLRYQGWPLHKKRRLFPLFSQSKASSAPKRETSHVTKRYDLSDVFDLVVAEPRKSKPTAVQMNFAGANPVPEDRLVRRRLDKRHCQFTIPSNYFKKSCETGCIGQQKNASPGLLAQLKLCAPPAGGEIFMVL